jgi:hypothetical protein
MASSRYVAGASIPAFAFVLFDAFGQLVQQIDPPAARDDAVVQKAVLRIDPPDDFAAGAVKGHQAQAGRAVGTPSHAPLGFRFEHVGQPPGVIGKAGSGEQQILVQADVTPRGELPSASAGTTNSRNVCPVSLSSSRQRSG